MRREASVPLGEWMLKERLGIIESPSLVGREFEAGFHIP